MRRKRFGGVEFRDGAVVMLCRHVYETACRGEQIDWESLTHRDLTTASAKDRETQREDGTKFECDHTFRCAECAGLTPHDVLYIEEVYRGGVLHVADFMRRTA